MNSWLPVRTCLGLVEHLLKVPHAKREDSFKLKSILAISTSSVAVQAAPAALSKGGQLHLLGGRVSSSLHHLQLHL